MSEDILKTYQGVCLDCKMPYSVLPRRTKKCFYCRTGKLVTGRTAPQTLAEGVRIHFERPRAHYKPEGDE
jgi:hypothetical protein